MSILVALLLVAPAYLVWAGAHELSHYLTARALRPVTWVSFRLYPHRDPFLGWVWASVDWEYLGEPYSPREDALIAFAPRLVDLVSVVATPFVFLLPEPLRPTWLVLIGAGLVDLAVGSVGWSEYSDLQRAARGWDLSPWLFRIVGWTLAVGSALLALTQWSVR